MAKRVYLETTIPSYLASWRSRDLLQAARQQITHDWWEHRRADYELCMSRIVLDEVMDGDADAAQRRWGFLDGIRMLELTEDVDALSAAIMQSGLLPPRAIRDAIHIAVTTVHAVDILLTWNCRHIANGRIIRELDDLVATQGYRLPVLCTPEELLAE